MNTVNYSYSLNLRNLVPDLTNTVATVVQNQLFTT